MLRLSPQEAGRRGNDVRSLKKTRRTRVSCHADILQNAGCPKEIVLITEAEPKSAQVDVGHRTCGRAQCAPEQDHVSAFVCGDLCCDIASNGFVVGKGDLFASNSHAAGGWIRSTHAALRPNAEARDRLADGSVRVELSL